MLLFLTSSSFVLKIFKLTKFGPFDISVTTRGLSVLCQEDGEGEICISHHEGISAGVDQL